MSKIFVTYLRKYLLREADDDPQTDSSKEDVGKFNTRPIRIRFLISVKHRIIILATVKATTVLVFWILLMRIIDALVLNCSVWEICSAINVYYKASRCHNIKSILLTMYARNMESRRNSAPNHQSWLQSAPESEGCSRRRVLCSSIQLAYSAVLTLEALRLGLELRLEEPERVD